MRPSEIELLAEQVLAAHEWNTPPVDVFEIARTEGIEMAPGNYGEDFSGRIEYHYDVGKFFLFHPDLEWAQHPARVRFSVGHELGHYFLDHHREILVRGASHNSTSDFIYQDHLEREADEFAAALLIPGFAMRSKLAKRKFMTLKEILLMGETWSSSATSAAIRYAKFTGEACMVVVSEDCHVLFWVCSEEAGVIGFRFLSQERIVPQGSATELASLAKSGFREQGISSGRWFPHRSREVELWEEAFPLGNTGRVLTLLAANCSN